MKKKFQFIAIIGFIAKGLIYIIIGILSLLSALNLGGESSGTNQALKFLEKQIFGNVLLALVGLGLLCYSYWMFYQAFKDPEDIGDDKKAKAQRFGLFTTGLVYVFVALLSFYHLFTFVSSGGKSSSYLVFFDFKTISYLFIAVGVILAIQGIILVIGVFKGPLLDQFHFEHQKGSKFIRFLGKFGFYSRAFIVVIIAFFFLRAGIYTGNHEIKGIKDAFQVMDQSLLGRIFMALTALGFIAYGCFYVLLSKYRKF
ncbi:DUF1206 domain-containing protein [Flavimarina sp. Hel_I_48]|uniref:DUF1206 domain-containing protein n=1 Tax=Flavimarina sp. Hel_I_48 TaxID=1392488 RepID=UPI00068B818E|nr:DUF1206 domain-containing protein [Flavimarina sp. Hel_I_48]